MLLPPWTRLLIWTRQQPTWRRTCRMNRRNVQLRAAQQVLHQSRKVEAQLLNVSSDDAAEAQKVLVTLEFHLEEEARPGRLLYGSCPTSVQAHFAVGSHAFFLYMTAQITQAVPCGATSAPLPYQTLRLSSGQANTFPPATVVSPPNFQRSAQLFGQKAASSKFYKTCPT